MRFLTEQTNRFRPRLLADPPDPKKAPPHAADPQFQALVSFCQALLGANPFLYVD